MSKQDKTTRPRPAEAAAAGHGWPLHIIEDYRDDPAVEQPKAFLAALNAAFPTSTGQETT